MQAKVSDYQINSRIRSILVSFGINVTRLDFGSCRGTVRFRGQLLRMGVGSGEDFSPVQLMELEMRIQSVRGVRRVYFEFENWKRNEDGWVAKGQSKFGRGDLSRGDGRVITVKGQIPRAKGARAKPTDDHDEPERVLETSRSE